MTGPFMCLGLCGLLRSHVSEEVVFFRLGAFTTQDAFAVALEPFGDLFGVRVAHHAGFRVFPTRRHGHGAAHFAGFDVLRIAFGVAVAADAACRSNASGRT